MSLLDAIGREKVLYVIQRRELPELFGYETRNKYELRLESGESIGFAAEQQKGILGFFFRQWFGHWRRFNIVIFDRDKRPIFRVNHPFRLFFQRLEIVTEEGKEVGALEQRFAFFSKCFDVLDSSGRELLRVRSPLWSPWTFAFQKNGMEVALLQKRWSGLLTEVFTDADQFRIQFQSASLSPEERFLVLAASLFVDLRYFEKKAE